MFKYKKNYFKTFFLFWLIMTIFIKIYHYWKINGRYYKPEWYYEYEILELEKKKYAIINYNNKNEFLIVEAIVNNDELILNMKNSTLINLINIPICYKKFKTVKIIK